MAEGLKAAVGAGMQIAQEEAEVAVKAYEAEVEADGGSL